MKKSLLLLSLFVIANSITVSAQAGVLDSIKKYAQPSLKIAAGSAYAVISAGQALLGIALIKEIRNTKPSLDTLSFVTFAIPAVIAVATAIVPATVGGLAIKSGLKDIKEIKAQQN